MEQIRQIDSKIDYIEQYLKTVSIVRSLKQKDFIDFGATVTLEKNNKERITYTIVGDEESDVYKGFISEYSKIARSMLWKKNWR